MSEEVDRVADTWARLGHRVRVLGHQTMVRSDPIIDTTEGGVVVPGADFYKGMPHQHLVGATVVSAGPKARVEVGARVAFQRLYFARYEQLDDGTYVGWVDARNLSGYLEGEVHATVG